MDKVKVLDKAFNLYERFFNFGISILIFVYRMSFIGHQFKIGKGDNVSNFAENILVPEKVFGYRCNSIYWDLFYCHFNSRSHKTRFHVSKVNKSKFLSW